jgi:hypothetical protein
VPVRLHCRNAVATSGAKLAPRMAAAAARGDIPTVRWRECAPPPILSWRDGFTAESAAVRLHDRSTRFQFRTTLGNVRFAPVAWAQMKKGAACERPLYLIPYAGTGSPRRGRRSGRHLLPFWLRRDTPSRATAQSERREPEKGGAPPVSSKHTEKRGRSKVIFRRFRRVRGGTRVLDAHDYGYEAWPIFLGR